MEDIKIQTVGKLPSCVLPIALAILLFGVDSFIKIESAKALEKRITQTEEHVKSLRMLTNDNFNKLKKHENDIVYLRDDWKLSNKKEENIKQENNHKKDETVYNYSPRLGYNKPILNWLYWHRPLLKLPVKLLKLL
jgi:hypothetical protein